MGVARDSHARQFVINMEEGNALSRCADQMECAFYQGLQVFGFGERSFAVIKIDQYMIS